MRSAIVLLVVAFPFFVGWAYELYEVNRLTPIGLFSAGAATLVPVRRIVALALATLLGILSSLAANVGAQDGQRLRTRLAKGLASDKTLLALAAAPMVFYGVYASSDQQPDAVTAVLLAYQNGFFWDSVFSRLSQGREH